MIEIYRSSRIENLALLLAEHLHRHRPTSILAPHTVLVGSVGIKRWLQQFLAGVDRRGLPRIAANLDMRLPSEWLDGLAQRTLGQHSIAIGPYRRQALRWRIHAHLQDLPAPEVQRYLCGEGAAQRRFQLADRLAGLYEQYLVYRKDWLLGWERGDGGPAHWQGELWRRLTADIGLPHRGQRMSELARRLPDCPPDPDAPVLHVFGLSHLPPDALTALEALSGNHSVQVYFPDPCRELWEDLRERRTHYAPSLAPATETADGVDSEQPFLDIGHPLLASLGRLGQHFALRLNGLDTRWDLRDGKDEGDSGLLAPGHDLLARVQHSLRCNRPDWVRADPADTADPRADASLRVHACHTRLRELEVLKDALLDVLARDPALEPRQIVVMAPNMARYAPLIPAVFGRAGDPQAPLPYRLADVALARSHPLLTAVRGLLDLPTQRITRSQVQALLAVPAVARRFDMDEPGRAALDRWLARSHVHWGLDGEMKGNFGAARSDEHSFAFGFDRMFAGYLMGQVAADTLLDGRILPADPVTGPDAACLAALWQLLALLREWRAQSRIPRSLAQWAGQLRDWFQRLFRSDSADEDERLAGDALARLLARLDEEERESGALVELPWAVVREVLVQGLEDIPERQPFLTGGITFCGMVPQRSIPFEVVALLGLNDGDYPRPRPGAGLDLMQQHPRLGDRDNRADDRYLFLEAIMSARRMLHLSYLGEGAQDGKPRNPALPLAELLDFLDQRIPADGHHDRVDKHQRGVRPWQVQHALQPFDDRYFDAGVGDPRFYSYSRSLAQATADRSAGAWRFLDGATGLIVGTAAARIELSSLASFFKDPSRWVCRQALKLSRNALDSETPEDDEPLSDDVEPRDQTPRELVEWALRAGLRELPEQAPIAIARSGRYAGGVLGRSTWNKLRGTAQRLLDVARELPPFAHGPTRPQTIAVDLNLGDVRLIGKVDGVYPVGDTLWLVKIGTSRPSFGSLLPLFLEWAALRLARPEMPCALRFVHRDAREKIAALPSMPIAHDPAQIRAGLETLLRCYRQADRVAGRYFARTSFAWAETVMTGKESALENARSIWLGRAFSDLSGERDYAPLHNRMMAGDESFLEPGSTANRDFEDIARALWRAISPATDGEAAA